MAQTTVEHAKIINATILERMKLSSRTLTLAGTLTMTNRDPIVNFLDTGGAARTVLLPAEEAGLFFAFVNTADAAEIMSIKDDSGTTTFATPTQAEAAVVFCNGVTWGGLVGASS